MAIYAAPYRLAQQSIALLTWSFPDASGQSFTNGALWSLAVEFWFYAGFATFSFLIRLFTRKPGVIKSVISGSAVALWIFMITGRAMIYLGYHPPLPFLITFDYMTLGVILAVFDLPERFRTTFARIGSFWPIVLVAVLAMIAFSRSGATAATPPIHDALQIALPLSGICFAILIMCGAVGSILPTMPKWLGKAMCLLGDRSYTIFLFHYPCFIPAFGIMLIVYPRLAGGDIPGMIAQVVSSAIVFLIVAEVVYRLIEMPMQRVGKTVERRLRAGTWESRTAPPAAETPSLVPPR